MISTIALLLLLSFRAPTTGSPVDLTNVRTLYASAAYEEALAELNKIDDANWDEHVDEYKALCLLALGQTREAEQTLEHLVKRSPLHSITNDRMSPRVVLLFGTVRWRMVPSIARELYANARKAYDGGRLEAAITQFRQLAALLSDANLLEQTPNLVELKELGEGFLKLAEARLPAPSTPAPVSAASAPAPVPAPAPAPAPPPAVAAEAAPGPVSPPRVVTAAQPIFTVDDRDVTPPLALERAMPKWIPGVSTGGPRTLRGLLEIVCDVSGRVESVKLVNSLAPLYDRQLLAAAKDWRFTPAARNGEPVRYKLLLEIVLNDR